MKKSLVILTVIVLVMIILTGCNTDSGLALVEVTGEDILKVDYASEGTFPYEAADGNQFMFVAIEHSKLPSIAAQANVIQLSSFSIEKEKESYPCELYTISNDNFGAGSIFGPTQSEEEDGTIAHIKGENNSYYGVFYIKNKEVMVFVPEEKLQRQVVLLIFEVPEDFDFTDGYSLVYRNESSKSVVDLSLK